MTATDEAAIAADLEAFLVAQFPATTSAGLDPDADLFETGIVDSVGVTETLAHIEAAFGVRIPDEALLSDDFTTVAGMARIVAQLLSGRYP